MDPFYLWNFKWSSHLAGYFSQRSSCFQLRNALFCMDQSSNIFMVRSYIYFSTTPSPIICICNTPKKPSGMINIIDILEEGNFLMLVMPMGKKFSCFNLCFQSLFFFGSPLEVCTNLLLIMTIRMAIDFMFHLRYIL